MESHGNFDKFLVISWDPGPNGGYHGIQKPTSDQVLFSEIPHMHWIPCEKDKELHKSRIPSSFGKAKGCLNGWDRLKAGIVTRVSEALLGGKPGPLNGSGSPRSKPGPWGPYRHVKSLPVADLQDIWTKGGKRSKFIQIQSCPVVIKLCIVHIVNQY